MTISRRTGLTAAATALLTGAMPATAGATTTHQGTALQKDVDAIRATGATAVLAEVQTAHDRTTARTGNVPWDAYYRIGSDTKTFTATIALQLVGEGRLSLTDTVEHRLPGLIHGNGNDGNRITLANLLRQTSGLNSYLDTSGFTAEAYHAGRFRPPPPPEQQVAAALRKPPGWLPDPHNPAAERRWGYSNTNYVILGMLIEQATGHPWAQHIHERIIEPLGLRHTFTPGTSVYVPQPTATAHTQFPGSTQLTDTTLAAGGGADGGIISTPHDLGVFLRALMRGQLLRPAQLSEMKRTVPADDWIQARGVRYGMGIAWRPVGGSASGIWFHGGTHLGVVSESGVTPDGATAATAAVFTLRMAGDAQQAQSAASLSLVDNALRRGEGRPHSSPLPNPSNSARTAA